MNTFAKKAEKFSISVNYFTFASRFWQKVASDSYRDLGDVAQLVEQRTENPCVGGSIPSVTTKN